ncbi:MAG TPA: class I SAM-dependent methyltransferase [Candidatus Binataceae bacterium]
MGLSESDVARYWNANAHAWVDHTRRGFDVHRLEVNNPAFFALIGDLSGRRVLDAGCGDGYHTRMLAHMGARIVGVDISDAMLATAREEENREPLGIRYEELSFAKLEGLADASFDAVVCMMALMDTPDLEGSLAEFARTLRPGGMFAFSILHPCFLTRGYEWVRDAGGRCTGLKNSDYFDMSSDWIDRWHFSAAGSEAVDFAIPRFHRTLSHYVNALIEAGFVLERVVEPRPSESFCQKYGAWHWREHAANYMQFRAHRANNASGRSL